MRNEKGRTQEGNVHNTYEHYNRYLKKLSSGSQSWKVLRYMRDHGSITQLEASDHLRITRLPARVHDLKYKYNVPIKSETVVKKDGTHYSKYFLGVEQ